MLIGRGFVISDGNFFLYFRALVIRTPEEMKETGNQHYKQQNYQEALNCYTQAISK